MQNTALKFKGFSLIKLVKAINWRKELDTLGYSYEVIIHDAFGRVKITEMKLNEIEKDWCKLRMTGDRFAISISGTVKSISEEEYNKHLAS
jgi:hypothetical protein